MPKIAKYLVKRNYFDRYLVEQFKRLSGLPEEIQKKKEFLITYGATTSFVASIATCNVSKTDFDIWMSDDTFRELFDYLTYHKKEVYEFILLCYAGVYGMRMRNRVKDINPDFMLGLLRVAVLNENNSKSRRDIIGKTEGTDGVLGRQDTQTSVSLEEGE